MRDRYARNVKAVAGVCLLIAILLVVGIVLFNNCGGPQEVDKSENNPSVSAVAQVETPQPPGLVLPIVNLEGVWTHKNEKGGVFEATVANDVITIVMKAPDGTSMTYWRGTFEPYKSVGEEITSTIVEDKAVLSQSTSKKFTIGYERVSFSFTMRGVTKTIDLQRV